MADPPDLRVGEGQSKGRRYSQPPTPLGGDGAPVRRQFSVADTNSFALARLRSLGAGSIDVLQLGEMGRIASDFERGKPFWQRPLCVPGRLVPVYVGGEDTHRPLAPVPSFCSPAIDPTTSDETKAIPAQPPVHSNPEQTEKTETFKKEHIEPPPPIPARESVSEPLEPGKSPISENDVQISAQPPPLADPSTPETSAHPITRENHSETPSDVTDDGGAPEDVVGGSYVKEKIKRRESIGGERRDIQGSVVSAGGFNGAHTLGRTISTPAGTLMGRGGRLKTSLSRQSSRGTDEDGLVTQRQISEADDMRRIARLDKYRTLLSQPTIDTEELRKISWSGIPPEVRPTAWKLLSGYLPANESRRAEALLRKREEYRGLVAKYFGTHTHPTNHQLHHQIRIDLPRTNPSCPLFQQEAVHSVLERILYIWAIRRPASGYVQGINDLVTPFFTVFLSAHVDDDVEQTDVSEVDTETVAEIEADAYWCLCRLLDTIQDNYTNSQPGIQRNVSRLDDLIKRVDATLYQHLVSHEIQFLQFAFRWMNCLLMREIPLRCTIRLWDTYLSEPNGFAELHLYVCAAFLVRWSRDLLKLDDFPSIITFLQSPPTSTWGHKDIELLVAEAYVWKAMFQNAPRHLT
eukprot:comp20727_c2_seq1/m.27087 comp20727_c2_seq1/g.27087  ORF comp20727_c2_seq1/g.27087 comp20727_c2_seq1/m.27087 type:complete len:633 (-) comp20727_c2_seq1:203-2101(-)